MPHPPPTPAGSEQGSRRITELEASVSELRRVLRRIYAEREEAAKRRRRRLLGLGAGISLIAHLILLLYFASVHQGGRSDQAGQPAHYEVAILPLTDLDERTEFNLDDLVSEQTEALDDPLADQPAVLEESEMPAGELEVVGDGPMPALGGAGESTGEDDALGGAGTSYFGVAARGTRFAYIVDRSGSMMHNERMRIATEELIRSIEALPDYAYFSIFMFSSGPLAAPPSQRGWLQARRSNVLQVSRWLRGVEPTGGTIPAPAFHYVFSMDVRPDVIFFMTDGVIAPAHLSAEELAGFNKQGKRVVINTIAFGDDGSEELLRQIARDSGGQYRYVPDGAR